MFTLKPQQGLYPSSFFGELLPHRSIIVKVGCDLDLTWCFSLKSVLSSQAIAVCFLSELVPGTFVLNTWTGPADLWKLMEIPFFSFHDMPEKQCPDDIDSVKEIDFYINWILFYFCSCPLLLLQYHWNSCRILISWHWIFSPAIMYLSLLADSPTWEVFRGQQSFF